MKPDSEGLRELKKEASILLLEKLVDIVHEDDFLERWNAINQKMREKYGHVITNILVGIIVETSQPGSEATNANQGVSKTLIPQVSIGVEDKNFLADMKVGLSGEEMRELRENLYSARMESITYSRQKMITSSQTKSDTDPRTNNQITNDLRIAAKKLFPGLRQVVARCINQNFHLDIPLSGKLENDTFWLQQIQATLDHIQKITGADDKTKVMLLHLERIVKDDGSSQ